MLTFSYLYTNTHIETFAPFITCVIDDTDWKKCSSRSTKFMTSMNWSSAWLMSGMVLSKVSSMCESMKFWALNQQHKLPSAWKNSENRQLLHVTVAGDLSSFHFNEKHLHPAAQSKHKKDAYITPGKTARNRRRNTHRQRSHLPARENIVDFTGLATTGRSYWHPGEQRLAGSSCGGNGRRQRPFMRRLTNWVATSRRSAFSVNIIRRRVGADGCCPSRMCTPPTSRRRRLNISS